MVNQEMYEIGYNFIQIILMGGLSIVLIWGYIANIVKLLRPKTERVVWKTMVRILGVFVPIVGSIFGFFK